MPLYEMAGTLIHCGNSIDVGPDLRGRLLLKLGRPSDQLGARHGRELFVKPEEERIEELIQQAMNLARRFLGMRLAAIQNLFISTIQRRRLIGLHPPAVERSLPPLLKDRALR
ncbi:MAG: hypothetical protein ACT4TC_20355 [Myxococcaceae bacterium]